jgi:hypothetical protein
MKVNQMFIVCNDFVSAKHDIYHLKCDLILICLLMCFKIKFEHFIHNVLQSCTITLLLSLLFMLSIKTKKSHKYMVPKFDAQTIKFKLSLGPKVIQICEY